MSSKFRLYFILWLAGMAGVLSFLLMDFSALLAALPQPEGTAQPELPSNAVLKITSIVQPAVLTSVAVLVGLWLAPKVDLHSPAAEAIADRKPLLPALRPQLLPGIIAGLATGVAIILMWVLAKPYLPEEFIIRAQQFNEIVPHAVRILYGGFTEELLLRWGVMTFLVWAFWRVFSRRAERPPAVLFVFSIAVSAIIFGIGHLPIAGLLAGGLTAPIVIYVVTANSIFGIVAGFLYWRKGLEAAMLAHMFAHLLLIASIPLGL